MGLIKIIKYFALSTGIPAFIPWIALILCTSCKNTGRLYDENSIDTDTDTVVPIKQPDTHTDTEDTQVLAVASEDPDELMKFMQNSEDWELYRKGILPRMTEKAPQYVKDLLNNTLSGFIAVDKSRMKVILFDKFGIAQKTYGMACAKNYGTKHSKGDSRTPEGFFYVEGIYDSTEWLFTDDNGITSQKKGQFGPRFIRLRIHGTSQIGIHGTCAPWSIGARTSHGCIRIKNENILELVELVEIGMPVIIIPGRKDIEQNINEGYDIPWVATSITAKDPVIMTEKDKADEAVTDTIISKDTIPVQRIDLENDTVKLLRRFNIEVQNLRTE